MTIGNFSSSHSLNHLNDFYNFLPILFFNLKEHKKKNKMNSTAKNGYKKGLTIQKESALILINML
jgi:hypothetical protein